MRRMCTFILASALLFGCGGGGSSSGGAGAEPLDLGFQLGTLRGDVPTLVTLPIAKPFYPTATLELAEAPTGAFEPLAGALPMSVESGQDVSLWVKFTPPPAPAAAEQEGTIRLLFRRVGGREAVPVTLHVRAKIETPSMRLMQTQVPAGNVFVGETAQFGVYVENTSVATPVTVTDVTPPDGDFSIAPDATPLPILIAAGSRLYVRLQYAPQELGSASSTIRVHHSAAADPLEATLTGTGIERPSARLLETLVSAGNVVVGETALFGVYIENTSVAATVTVTDVTPPDGEFSLAPDAPALPIQVAAGAKLCVPLMYTPQGAWDASSTVRVYTSAAEEPLEATVTGTGIEPRLVFEYDVELDANFESEWRYLEVPAEGVSILLEATGDPSSLIDLIGFEETESNTVYVNYDMTGPLDWASFYPAGGRGYLNVELPNSDVPEVQLVSGGGTYRFKLRDSYGATGSLQVRVTVSQRTAGTVEEGTLDLRIFLADGLKIDPGAAMYDAKLADALKTLDAILGTSGIRLGNISVVPMDSWYDWLYGDWHTEEMIVSNTAGLPEGPLNLFFVTEMDYGIGSVAGAVPGPTANGTPYSGVVIDFNDADGIALGAAAAHQIVHYLGAEVEGIFMSEDEAYPVLRHPLLNPGLPQDFLSPPESTDYSEILATIDEMPAMDTWCGTCTRPSARY